MTSILTLSKFVLLATREMLPGWRHACLKVLRARPTFRWVNFKALEFYCNHGKSTLADRLLELTGTIETKSTGLNQQVLDKLKVERERGITVKAQTARNEAKDYPVLTKIDLPASQPERMAAQLQSTFGIDPSEILHISAKTGQGCLRYRYRGVISLVSIQDGIIQKGDKIASCHTRKKYEITEVGVMHPEEVPTSSLQPGQVGYIACNMKESSEAHIGDTLHRVGALVDPMPGFQPSKAMLTLTDRSVTIQRESSTALGQGCRLGFLGTLHMDVFRQRLEDEYDANIIITAPTVPYKTTAEDQKVIYKDKTVMISNPTEFPDTSDTSCKVKQVQEPVVNASIIVPEAMNGGYKASDLAKMVFLLNGKPVDALALIVHRSAQHEVGKKWVKKLHKVIPRQLFEVPIQAAVGKKIIARETLSAMRADVTAGLYGGHYERKMKHLENQKESKRKMKHIGSIDLPQDTFFDILSTKSN
ncbi:translation factor GUF1, mitochondrial [Suillus variegatus]|nr:translation factor GUF1, mitochondrial [Suillus variegatus]